MTGWLLSVIIAKWASVRMHSLFPLKTSAEHLVVKVAGARLDPGNDSCGVCLHDHS